jgi:hypothetical protein
LQLKRPLMIAAAVVLLGAIAVHLTLQYDELRQLSRLSAAVAIGSVLLLLGSHLAHNESILVPLRVHLPSLAFWELFLVRTGGLVLGSAVPVAGGVAVRLAYLRRQGITFADFAHATLLSNVLALVAGACLAIPATAALWAIDGAPPTSAVGLVTVVLALGIGALVALQALPALARHPRLSRWLPAIRDGSVRGGVAFRVFWASTLRHLFSFIAFGWLYSALSDTPGGFLAGGLVYTITTPIRMVNLTPGNVGVNEWAVAVAGRALAFDLTTGLLVGGVFRVSSLVAQGIGVLLGWARAGSAAPPAARP